jgi:anti-sigma factor RsiW
VSQFPHDEFLALCALSTSGELTQEEWNRLQEHLPGCHTCREAMKQYDAVADSVIPALTPAPESL